MNTADLIAALALPSDARVDRRVPKKLLLEQGAPTPADKRQINDGVEELFWVAALKPTTIGVPEYRDAVREYLEIAVLSLTVRPGAKSGRLTELVHRAVPYPVLLVTEQPSRLGLSLAHKRWSQGESGKTVLDGEVIEVALEGNPQMTQMDADYSKPFLNRLAIANQSRTNLLTLYQGWVDTFLALHAAQMTGTFAVAASAEHAAERREALQECARLEAQISALRAAAEKETQIARQVEHNLELKRLKARLESARGRL